MKILVTGANGQLGSEMRLLAKDSADEYIFTDVNQVEGQETVFLDITDRQAIMQMVQTQGIDAIVNCAAWTNVDACETDPALAALAQRLNADAPENLALAMKAVGGLLVHISTDYVFGTEPYNTPCREDQQGTPTGVYGRTKKEGEERILATGCQHVIIRTAWLYSEFGKNFCRTMLQLTAERPTLNVVYDQCGTPTYALDLARAICTILQDYGQTENGKRKTENCSVQTENSAHSLTAERVDKAPLTAHHYPKTGIYHYS
ncbi:MAG: sugar nucleotide-binding protein, partial [Bacteroidaceae bacterium]|nr:sugar nucleotide-binding protein [Bacteroidaceae bacterium]